MKYLLLIYYANGIESYYADDPDKLKEYAKLKNCRAYYIYELNKTVYCEVYPEQKRSDDK